jgi:hypothetical protein
MRENLSHHAGRRLQQRALPPFVVDLLMGFGAAERCGGAERFFFDKAARKRLRDHFGGKRGLRLVEPFLDTYAVVADDGTVVTVAHRTGRVHRR